MSSLSPLMELIDAYALATGLSDKTISSRVFKDSKKVAALREGGDITTARLDEAVFWFSDHWPEDAVWPHEVPRPARSESLQTIEALRNLRGTRFNRSEDAA